MSASRTISPVAAAFLATLGLDLFLHGGLLARVYLQLTPFLLAPKEALRRIPIGYASILVLTVALFWLFRQLGVQGTGRGLRFGTVAGGVIWGGFALGLYSVSTAPLALMAAWWVGQTLELGLAGAVLGASTSGIPMKRIWVVVVAAVIALVIATVVVQSVGLAPHV